jgi:hypothetical protein
MSFDIWLGNFNNGVSAPFARSIVDQAFMRFIERREPLGWILRIPDGGRADMSIADTTMIEGLAVNLPTASSDFWEGILYILQRTTSVLFWPGTGCVVASEAVIPELPKNFWKKSAPQPLSLGQNIFQKLLRVPADDRCSQFYPESCWIWRAQGDSNPCFRRERATS